MDCKKCSTSEINDIFRSSCVATALEVIKAHFNLFKKIAEDRGKEIDLLTERNESLTKAVEFLERNRIKEGSKRRKKNIQGDYTSQTNNFDPTFPANSQENSVCDSEMNSPTGRTSDLNLALNMFDSSILTLDETIGETEKVNSPRKHTLWSAKRQKQRQSVKNCENIQANATSPLNTTSNWMGKDHGHVESKKLSNILTEKKTNFSLSRKQDRLKQTKLTFDVKKSNTKDYAEREVIAESPNLYSALKQAKQSRSLMLRTGNSNISSENLRRHKSAKELIRFDDFDDDDDDENSDHFFDFNETKRPSPKTVAKEPKQLSQNSDTSSVVILTPATQDIIFVDDSHIGTMDLLEDMLQNDSLENLKRFEAKGIDKQKATNQIKKAKTESKTNTAVVSSAPVKIKKEPKTQDQYDHDNETTMLPEEFLMAIDQAIDKNQELNDENSLDEEFVQPIIVKQESDIPTTSKTNLKERFNISCDECLKFLEIFGKNLNDRQIENHLSNCKHQKELERLGHETPPGFWNPLMESFADDDPRREVYIDTRFVNKEKHK